MSRVVLMSALLLTLVVSARAEGLPEAAPPNQQGKLLSDNRLRTEVLAAIVNDPAVDPFQFRIVVEDGNVGVLGQGSSRQKERVTETIGRVSGVRSVDNEVRTPLQSSASSTALSYTDRDIVKVIYDQLARDEMGGSSALNIHAKDGAVTLEGKVSTRANAFLIEKAAMLTPGVLNVENLLQIESRHLPEDSSLLRQVRSALRSDAVLAGERFAIEAHQGEVRISGKVDSPLKIERTTAVVAHLNGVRVLSNELELE